MLEKMEIKRFFVSPSAISDGIITITGDEHVHLSNVLRFRVGYKLIVCDNSGLDYHAEVVSINSTKTICKIEFVEPNLTEHKTKIILLYGLIKPEKFEIGLQKAVELGVSEIIPFISLNTQEKTIRIDRLKRIVLEACKQCGRSILPTICEPVSFDEALSRAEGLKIIAYEKEKQKSFKSVLKNLPEYDKVSLAIGSEGGFTVDEVECAESQGFVSVSLGLRILRAETAVITGLANISLFLED